MVRPYAYLRAYAGAKTAHSQCEVFPAETKPRTGRPAYFHRLLTFLRQKGQSKEDAEDLIQEALLRLHTHSKSAAIQNTEAFLRHAVSNLAIDQYRRERLRIHRTLSLAVIDCKDELIATGPMPDQILDSEQRLNEISDSLNAVSPRTRQIYLAHRSGYSYAEIAAHMDIAETTVKRHIRRALSILTKLREKSVEEDKAFR